MPEWGFPRKIPSMKVQQFLAITASRKTHSVRRTPRPTTFSASSACTPPTIRRGTKSTETPKAPGPRSCSAKRGAARRPSGCRWSMSWPPTTRPIPIAAASSLSTTISIPSSTRSATAFMDATGGRTGCLRTGGCGTTWTRSSRWASRGSSARSPWPATRRKPGGPTERPPSSQTPPHVETQALDRLTRDQKRDLLLLAAFYEHSYDRPPRLRWNALRRSLRFSTWRAKWDLLLGLVVTVATVGLVIRYGDWHQLFRQWWIAAIIVAGWLPWLLWQVRLLWIAWRTSREIRVFDHLTNTLRGVLSQFERRGAARPAHPHEGPQRRPLRAFGQVPGHFAGARIFQHHRRRRSGRRAAPR